MADIYQKLGGELKQVLKPGEIEAALAEKADKTEVETGLAGKVSKAGDVVTGNLGVNLGTYPCVYVRSTNEKISNDNICFGSFESRDKDNFFVGRFYGHKMRRSDGVFVYYAVNQVRNAAGDTGFIGMVLTDNEERYGIAPNPAADSNANHIATTQWVRNLVASVASGASVAADIPSTMSLAAYSEDGTEQTRPLTTDELFEYLRTERNIRLAEYDAAISRLNREKRGLSSEDEIAAIDGKIAEWDAYAAELCALPSKDGAPWDGGGSGTPWPVKPAI